MTTKRRSPGTKSRATSTTTTIDTQRVPPAFADMEFDKSVVDAVNRDLWQALFDGHFRLSIRCDRCGRWLTAGPSKKARMGSHCAAKAVGDAR